MKTLSQIQEEILSELKIKTMGNYVQKASSDKSNIERTYLHHSLASKKEVRNHRNRSIGIRTAKDKIKDKMSNLKVTDK